MEAIGALASTLQIVGQCGQVTMTVIRWVESVRTVDERIDAFINEVTTLRTTYESLDRSLRDHSILEAARITNRDVGGHLWTQLSRTLHDCQATMQQIINILAKIQSSSNFLRPVLKQLKESLYTGELCRLREQVVLFNSSLQLPMQMITLTLQLRQQEMTAAHQLHLNEQLVLLRKGIERIERISSGLSKPKRTETASSVTMVDNRDSQSWVENIENYVGTAKKFLDSASVAASTLSAPSTKNQDEESPVGNTTRRGSAFIPITFEKMKQINSYVEDLVPADSGVGTGTHLQSEEHSEAGVSHNPIYDSDDEDDDVDLQILQALLQNGQSEVTNQNYASAEENYREALILSQGNNFGSQIACSSTDIALMLGDCLVKQEKYDETIDLLQPLASQHPPHGDDSRSGTISNISASMMGTDKGQMLAANHLLGKVYLKKADYANAEKNSVVAFKGRKKLLGESHPRTIESVHLVIEMYKAKGQNARAEAHRVFLKPAQEPRTDATPEQPSERRVSPMTTPMLPPTSTPQTKQRRPTFNISSHFRRSEKPDSPPVPIPISRGSNSHFNTPFLAADEVNRLSSSPGDTSSLHTGLDHGFTERQVRTQSINSIGNHAQLQRWTTGSDIAIQPTATATHPRASSSISKPPTLYAALSPMELEQRFLEVSNLQAEGKSTKAFERALVLLQLYDPESKILVHRQAELKDNIKKAASRSKGLAGTGHGFSPLHFFVSMKYEALTEIDILLRLGADPNAIAYKAGYNKVDPFTPLSLSIDRSHENVVRMLCSAGASWDAEAMCSGTRINPDRDTLHPLLQAVQKGNPTIVRILLEHGLEMTEDMFPRLSWHGNCLLHEACYRSDVDIVQVLLEYATRQRHFSSTTVAGTSTATYSYIGTPAQQDEFGMTAVMYAVDMRDYNEKLRAYKLRNRIACLRLLLGLKSNPTITTDEHHISTTIDTRPLLTDETSTSNTTSPIDASTHRPISISGAGAGSAIKPNTLAMSLHLQDKRGNTVYWYVDETRAEDAELIRFLDEQARDGRLIDL